MIRFWENISCIEYKELKVDDVLECFRNTFLENVICVTQNGKYVGNITFNAAQESSDIYGCISTEYVYLNQTVWENSRQYFSEYPNVFLPVLNDKHEVICYAWQDDEANREVRMLRELEELADGVDFRGLYSDYQGVTIYECNELAWKLAKYLLQKGIMVNVQGKYWDDFQAWDKYEILSYQNYEIWAEGVQQKCRDWRQHRLRSVSVEFECLDKIYEANIESGKITDAADSGDCFLDKLRGNKEIVIRGIGTKAQDVYDWLLSNMIDICAFQSDRNTCQGILFGKPVMKRKSIFKRFPNAIILECSAVHSAWGFGDVDFYDYAGFRRNQQYFLIRDYVDVPENNLCHIMKGKELVLFGDPYLCKRAWKWWNENGVAKTLNYCDISGEHKDTAIEMGLTCIEPDKQKEGCRYLMYVSEYDPAKGGPYGREGIEKQYADYIKILEAHEIYDYTDYFSDVEKSILLTTERGKYTHIELCPSKILLGTIETRSGNLLFRQILSGHPQIIMIQEYCFFNNRLYDICIRLAEEVSDKILTVFWQIYQSESKSGTIEQDFPYKDRFDEKMKELLQLSLHFTSQELFVMFHLAYEAMYGRENLDLKNIVIYWEPHNWPVQVGREWAGWLSDEKVPGITIQIFRNRCTHAGACIRGYDLTVNNSYWGILYNPYTGEGRHYANWKTYKIRFEDLKCQPEKALSKLCQKVGIAFHKCLLETTYHGEKASSYMGISGFDLKPVYNLYEEFYSGFDRARISILAASYQKEHGYPYVDILDFSRRELQEMFLKNFRFEALLDWTDAVQKDYIDIISGIRRDLSNKLWAERYAAFMKSEMKEKC